MQNNDILNILITLTRVPRDQHEGNGGKNLFKCFYKVVIKLAVH